MMDNYSRIIKAPLILPSLFYYLVQKTREKLYKINALTQEFSRVPVISIGNIAMGGRGKTPVTISLAELLVTQGYKTCIVSRGYKGNYRGKMQVVSTFDSLSHSDYREVGDEPKLMAEKLPGVSVIVASKRIDGCMEAKNLSADVVILDDGFQHLQLKRDIDIVLLDGSEDYMFPYGYLREPISALRRADIILLRDEAPITRKLDKIIKDKTVFGYKTVPIGILRSASTRVESISSLNADTVILCSGIAGPERFAATVTGLQLQIAKHLRFPDHHAYTADDLAELARESQKFPVLFTEKDWVKLPDEFKTDVNCAALVIDTRISNQSDFLKLILMNLDMQTNEM